MKFYLNESETINMIDYEKLKQVAIETKAELVETGKLDIGRQKVRRKPRAREDLEIFFERAIDKTMKYMPFYDSDGKLVLPFFF